MAPRVAGVLLAGGASERMGRPKATLRIGEETFAGRLLRALGEAGLERIVVVAGVHAEETRAALPRDVRLLVNPDPSCGQLSSLKIALRDLTPAEPPVDAALVALVDHPAVRVDTLVRLREASASRAIVVPRHGGRRGHPVVFARALFEELLEAPVALGARTVVRRDPARVLELDVDDAGVLVDVDTPADLAHLRSETA
ncbi:MAG: nucleotidyltransferase family protein [Deltaproteobacteria bacterium]|nr:nucleotidyltransferase family protein [Deltaproteobacteria bacterium]